MLSVLNNVHDSSLSLNSNANTNLLGTVASALVEEDEETRRARESDSSADFISSDDIYSQLNEEVEKARQHLEKESDKYIGKSSFNSLSSSTNNRFKARSQNNQFGPNSHFSSFTNNFAEEGSGSFDPYFRGDTDWLSHSDDEDILEDTDTIYHDDFNLDGNNYFSNFFPSTPSSEVVYGDPEEDEDLVISEETRVTAKYDVVDEVLKEIKLRNLTESDTKKENASNTSNTSNMSNNAQTNININSSSEDTNNDLLSTIFQMPNVIYLGVAVLVLLIIILTCWMHLSKKKDQDRKVVKEPGYKSGSIS